MNGTDTPVRIRANGKLLLMGEYVVLDGALSLALPVRYGQVLEVTPLPAKDRLDWHSLNETGDLWFQASFRLPGLDILQTSDRAVAGRLQQMLEACRRQQPGFLPGPEGYVVQTRTDFPRNWGLGTSSTLIAALAQWAQVDPYAVLFETLGGSGYDIACAFADGPVLYRLSDQKPEVERVRFDPPFADSLYFVFLEQKQDSREGIRRYREQAVQRAGLVSSISALTRQCLQAATLTVFGEILLEHERLISGALGLSRVQDRLFPDFPGVIKSLGAWGGDFVLAVPGSPSIDMQVYFRDKGFTTCIPYREMVL
ncbi:MAG: GHMP kinase [Bacteroidetes bacterium]|nr:MAG: GHMP kinase [Bacteroidota bacterium]